MCNINQAKFPCIICAKYVQDKDKAVQCDLCELWIHIKCNNLNYLDYRYLQNCDESWYYIECCSTIFSFNSLSSNKNFLTCCTSTDSNITRVSPSGGGLGGSPHYLKNWLVPPCPPTVLTRFCNFHAVFGHFAQTVTPLVDPNWETPITQW